MNTERLSKLLRATQLVCGQGENQAVLFSIPQEITKNKEAGKFFPPHPNLLQCPLGLYLQSVLDALLPPSRLG